MKSKLQLNEDSTFSAQFIYQLCEFPSSVSPAIAITIHPIHTTWWWSTTATKRVVAPGKKMSNYFLQLLLRIIRWWWMDGWMDWSWKEETYHTDGGTVRYLPKYSTLLWRHNKTRAYGQTRSHQLFIMLVMSRLRNHKPHRELQRVDAVIRHS